ncbi:MAG: ABC transporter substrate-binding protein [Bryobacteraceae bacterium]|nr:ABC transporter substrate-binding protein [Bryobacteraceae bacterium]
MMWRLAISLMAGAVAALADGVLTISMRSEPRTLNPVVAVDAPSRELMRLLHGRLARIHGVTHVVEPSLATAWKFSSDGRSAVVTLRKGVTFSDGDPFDADDVLFSFQVYLDGKVASPQRSLLMPGGKPVTAEKLTSHSIRLHFAEPHGPGERMFDGIPILPKHRLEGAYREGKLAGMWTVSSAPGEIAGLGPFVMAQYAAGEKIVLKRNPRFWMRADGKALPYLDEVRIVFTPDQTAEALRFRAGEIDLISRPPAQAFASLGRDLKDHHFIDSGSSLEYHFVFFNLNDAPDRIPAAVAARQKWFSEPRFRRAVSLAADRQGMARLAFEGRATPLAHHVTAGNRLWVSKDIRVPARSLEEGRRLLLAAGFRMEGSALVDSQGKAVEFTLAYNSGNAQQGQMATLLQEDLRPLGIRLRLAPLEFRALVNRVLKTLDYDAALMALGSGDADPNAEMNVWHTSGAMHVWNLSARNKPTAWEAEIDRHMRQQQSTRDFAQRRKAYHRVQELVAEHLPILSLVSPNLLTAHRPGLENVRPSILPPYALWNIEQFRWANGKGGAQ